MLITVILCYPSGISEEKTLNPVQLAAIKTDRLNREKAAAVSNLWCLFVQCCIAVVVSFHLVCFNLSSRAIYPLVDKPNFVLS